MRPLLDVINLWKDWKPTVNFVCPYRIVHYYWTCYWAKMSPKPLFPRSEVNDVAAVIAGSKPVAVMTLYFKDDENQKLLEEIVPIALSNNIKYLSYNENTYIFSFKDNVKEMKKIWQSGNLEELGAMLGYPKEAVQKFAQNQIERFLKYGIKGPPEERYIVNEEYIKRFLPIPPEFKISSDWFEYISRT